MAKIYTVGNPRGIQAGVPILQLDEHMWYEGDEFTPPASMTVEAIARRVGQGMLVEKEGARG